MPALEDLLRQFELALLPHERYFVAQGLVAPFWRDLPELAAGYGVSSYLDAQAALAPGCASGGGRGVASLQVRAGGTAAG